LRPCAPPYRTADEDDVVVRDRFAQRRKTASLKEKRKETFIAGVD
jgi:hypothetical protein